MQPYINPYLFSNPIYSNYVQQPMQQPQQPVGIPGKYVNSFDEIMASDIPMSGPAIFAKNDRSEIQIREWQPDGQIGHKTYRVVPEEIQRVEVPQVQPFNASDVLDPIFEKLTELEGKLDKLTRPTAVSKTAKKDGE